MKPEGTSVWWIDGRIKKGHLRSFKASSTPTPKKNMDPDVFPSQAALWLGRGLETNGDLSTVFSKKPCYVIGIIHSYGMNQAIESPGRRIELRVPRLRQKCAKNMAPICTKAENHSIDRMKILLVDGASKRQGCWMSCWGVGWSFIMMKWIMKPHSLRELSTSRDNKPSPKSP